MHLSSLCNAKEFLDCAGSKLPVVVFGTGSQGLATTKYLEDNSIPVAAFCETSAYYRPGKIICGKPVYEYETLSSVFTPQSTEGGYGCNLFFAASGEGVEDMWRNPPETVKKYFVNMITPLYGEVKMTAEWVNEHIDVLDETYHLLSDEHSRSVFLSYIDERAHCLKAPAPHLFELYTSDGYFNDLYDFDRFRSHALADCGAYTGDTAGEFLTFLKAHGKTGRVFAFEPDKQNLEQIKTLAKNFSTAEREKEKIKCFPYAVGEKKGTLSFATGLGVSSHCLEKGSNEDNVVQIPVVALDEVLFNTEVSIIKMDIEGGELAALKGAKRIITEQMPFLAICVYHRDDDLITIPQYIRGLAQKANRTYRFYLRHHYSYMPPYDTVLYAVPE